MNNIPYLLLCDFDQTLFDTKKPSPNGVGLEEGYQYAVNNVFGPLGLAIYQEEGGLRNRAPIEVVTSLIKHQSLISSAQEKYAELTSSTENLPALLTVPWNEASVCSILTEMLVHSKLQLFLGEIGIEWPQQYPGVCSYFQTITDLRVKKSLPIHSGILSSGHTSFIEKTLCLRGIPYPQVMITDDHIRPIPFLDDPGKKVKPSPFLIYFLLERWLKNPDDDSPASVEKFSLSLSRVLYIGDDPQKDGEMAKNVGIPFGWFRGNCDEFSEISQDTFPFGSFSFSNWHTLCDFLKKDSVRKMVRRGMPIAKIFSRFGRE